MFCLSVRYRAYVEVPHACSADAAPVETTPP